MIATAQVSRELVLTAAMPTDALAAWLRDVERRAAGIDPGDATFLIVTPLGFERRDLLLERLEEARVEVRCRTIISSWPRVASAIRVVHASSARLRRAARFEAVWQSLYPKTPAEAWALAPGALARAFAVKRALRREFPSLEVDLGDGLTSPNGLHAFHLPDLLDAREEARRLLAALALLGERSCGPRRRFEDLLDGATPLGVEGRHEGERKNLEPRRGQSRAGEFPAVESQS